MDPHTGGLLMPMERHPIADLFPPMDAHDYGPFKASIQSEGQKVPCLTWRGKLADGVHRERACEEIGIACRYEECQAADEAAMIRHVVALNVARRHLTATQQATLAFDVKPLYAAAAKDRQRASGGDRKSAAAKSVVETVPQPIREPAPKSRDLAAATVGVSGRTVDKVAAVVKAAPDLLPKMRSGELTASRAAAIVARRERESAMQEKAKAAASAPDAGAWEIQTGDAVELLAAVPAGSVRLVFADPPYNIGFDYGQGKDADLLPRAEYLAWCWSWVEQIPRALTDDGSVWVLINDEWADEFGRMLRAAGLHRRQWLVWYESFGVNNPGGFNRCSRHLFWTVKDPARHVFHPEAVNRPSAREAVYGDKRAQAGGKTWDSVWGVNPEIPRVPGTSKERMEGFPTQLPLRLLTPIVRCASDPGDLVLDPFNGSGTTGEAALRSGRRYLGFERNGRFADAARIRLRAASVEGTTDGHLAEG
jgi:DNA modification methylase/ParB-like chromosome segregation protein Spo0J